MDILDFVHQKQTELKDESAPPPPHEPEMLLIGCVDARKDIIADLGLPKGKTLVLRNVAALIHPEAELRLTESAGLAFAVRHMKVKHITVMGHTDCGGIHAAIAGVSSYSLRDYLRPLQEIRDDVCKKTDDLAEQRWLLEQESVKYSVNNLRSYDYIREAEQAGDLQLHGWVLNIGSGRIYELDENTGEFSPMDK